MSFLSPDNKPHLSVVGTGEVTLAKGWNDGSIGQIARIATRLVRRRIGALDLDNLVIPGSSQFSGSKNPINVAYRPRELQQISNIPGVEFWSERAPSIEVTDWLGPLMAAEKGSWKRKELSRRVQEILIRTEYEFGLLFLPAPMTLQFAPETFSTGFQPYRVPLLEIS